MKQIITTSIVAVLVFASCNHQNDKQTENSQSELFDQKSATEVKLHYTKVVYANYQDCLKTAELMQQAILDFVVNPSDTNLKNAQAAWLTARKPYGQSEVYRFYEGPIDDADGPEGLLNAWPLDEAYIESDSSDSKGIIQDVATYPEITQELIVSLNEKDGEETISTGYHAIEFLLWGEDKYANSAGKRPVSDFTTDEFAPRRIAYLKVASQQLVDHLSFLVKEWEPAKENYRAKFEALDNADALKNILN